MRALMQKPSSESILTTFLHQAFPEGAMVETDASGHSPGRVDKKQWSRGPLSGACVARGM
jgi:hypothetical protein